MWKLINSAAQDVRDPKTGGSVYDAWRNRARENAPDSELFDDNGNEKPARAPRIGALGSGSDYTPFLQHLGIASLDMGFGGEDNGGTYHSIYDSFAHYQRFGDPDFVYGIALAQTAGRAVLRLAEADVLPFEFTAFADTLGRYVK